MIFPVIINFIKTLIHTSQSSVLYDISSQKIILSNMKRRLCNKKITYQIKNLLKDMQTKGSKSIPARHQRQPKNNLRIQKDSCNAKHSYDYMANS